MTQLKLKILTICLPWMFMPVAAQEIWHESFSLHGKGIHGNEAGSVITDFSGITSWSLIYDDVLLFDEGDYAQTVSTSGGRFEACDIDGEVKWLSEWIPIDGTKSVNVELTAAETGSGNNMETKYMKVCYLIDDGEEMLFSENGYNAGNWGSVKAIQEGLSGTKLRIVCYMSTHYAADKVILDEVTVWATQEALQPVQPFEVVINELMADPVPRQGLPAVEYIELYNTRNTAVRTEGWQLSINGISKNIPESFIEPDRYLLLCATGSKDSLQGFENVVNVPGFQGLLNKGASVAILDQEGVVIDEVAYTDWWYKDELKTNGGWSLERIDPYRNCNQQGNWLASLNPEGGTPGELNSVYGKNTDDMAPVIRWAVAVSAFEVDVDFSEPIDSMSLTNLSNYSLEGCGNPDSVKHTAGETYRLHFSRPLAENENYLLSINGLYDECNNILQPAQINIQWNFIEPDDVLISEVLFNPYPGCADFVEVYNKSDKIIDLSRLYLTNNINNDDLNESCRLTTEHLVLFPDEYLVLTEDTASLFLHYLTECRYCFLQLPGMPSFPNAEGDVVLINERLEVIDRFTYTEKMHSPFLADTRGISLERLSFQDPADNRSNWHSASEEAGYATPGYKNSQAGPVLSTKPVVIFEPAAISPNYDGYNDAFYIRYQVSGPGYVATVRVFDVTGRYVHTVASNRLLGTEGEISWSGKDETGRRLPLGVYVVALELFNASGEVYRYREGVVLTDILY